MDIATTRMVRAWDLPTRLFHWSLVVLIAAAYVTVEFSEELGDPLLKWHRRIGYAILVLLVWRLLWGFLGSSTSRFSSFVKHPWTALGYARDLARDGQRRFLGHNPLGGWMVVALLSALGAQAVLGLFTTEHNDLAAGPLARLASEDWLKPIRAWHRFIFDNVIVSLVALHVVAIAAYGVLKKERLVPAMITGRKPTAAFDDATEAQFVPRPLASAALCLAAAAALVFGTITALGGRL